MSSSAIGGIRGNPTFIRFSQQKKSDYIASAITVYNQIISSTDYNGLQSNIGKYFGTIKAVFWDPTDQSYSSLIKKIKQSAQQQPDSDQSNSGSEFSTDRDLVQKMAKRIHDFFVVLPFIRDPKGTISDLQQIEKVEGESDFFEKYFCIIESSAVTQHMVTIQRKKLYHEFFGSPISPIEEILGGDVYQNRANNELCKKIIILLSKTSDTSTSLKRISKNLPELFCEIFEYFTKNEQWLRKQRDIKFDLISKNIQNCYELYKKDVSDKKTEI